MLNAVMEEGHAMKRTFSSTQSDSQMDLSELFKPKRGDGPAQPEIMTKQWVSSVIEYSSEYGTPQYSHLQLVGPPRTFPTIGSSPGAWCNVNSNAFEFFVCKFKNPVAITAVGIYQVSGVGPVVRIAARQHEEDMVAVGGEEGEDEETAKAKLKELKLRHKVPSSWTQVTPDGMRGVGVNYNLPPLPEDEWVVLWEGPASRAPASMFSPPLSTTKVISNVIRVDLDVRAQPWVEIDCVRLKGFRNVLPGTYRRRLLNSTSSTSTTTPILNTPHKGTLAYHQSALVGSSEFADVVIVLDDGTRMPAHKAILACRSEVFRAMLTSGMKESTSNEIHLKDVSASNVRLLLMFLYTDTIGVPPEDIVSMFCLADQFNLDRLKSHIVITPPYLTKQPNQLLIGRWKN